MHTGGGKKKDDLGCLLFRVNTCCPDPFTDFFDPPCNGGAITCFDMVFRDQFAPKAEVCAAAISSEFPVAANTGVASTPMVNTVRTVVRRRP